jgi:hypothetical protein
MADSKLRLKPGVDTLANSLLTMCWAVRDSAIAAEALKAKRSMSVSCQFKSKNSQKLDN